MSSFFTERWCFSLAGKEIWSVNPFFATRRDLVLVPYGASFHASIHLIVIIRLIGTPAQLTILTTGFEIHWSTSVPFASSINFRPAAARSLKSTSVFRLASEVMNDK